MCYSAQASFIAGGVLTATSLAIARTPKEKGSLPLALIPAIFAVHQFTEGFIWLSQGAVEMQALEAAAVSLYVFIAYAFWPVFIPLAVYRLETDRRRRMMILICQALGLGVGLSYLLGMLRSPVDVSVYTCHLAYQVRPVYDFGLAYLFAVSVPFLVSSRRGLVLFGLGALFTFAVGLYVARLPAFPSVWCFFAAFLSAGLYAYFRAANRATEPQVEVQVYQGR